MSGERALEMEIAHKSDKEQEFYADLWTFIRWQHNYPLHVFKSNITLQKHVAVNDADDDE